MDVPVKAVKKVAYWNGVVHMGGEISVFVDFVELSLFPFEEGASALVSRGDEDVVFLDNWRGCIGAVAGFPFFESKGFAVCGVENHESIGFEDGNQIGLPVRKGSRGTVGGPVGLALPLGRACFFVEGEGRALPR